MRFGKQLSFDEQLQKLQEERIYFNEIIGGWPTRIRDAREGKEVRKRWDQAVNDAQYLLKQRPSSIDAKFVLGDLLRMGHNIDVQGAAQASHTLLKEIIQTDPKHFKAHYSLAAMYISIDPNAAPLAEQLFLKAETLAIPEVIPSVYSGLGFSCLYQNRVPDAIVYFEKYLHLKDDAEIRKLFDQLKLGKKPTIVR